VRAVQIVSHEGPQAVRAVEVSDPTPGPDDVLIRVRAAGVSFPELLQSRGKYQNSPDLPFIPGAEVAGEIISAPEGSGIEVGDRVAAFSLIGAFAEKATAATERVFPIGDSVTFEQAASLPLNYLTAYFGLVQRGQMAKGETVLVQGAAGGVGSAAIQIAKAFGSGKVIAVTSTPEKGEIAVGAGADEYVLADGFKDAVLGGASAGGVDIVFDTVGGDRFTDSLRCLKDDGRLIVIGFTGGEIPTVKVNRLLLNNISVVGAGLGVYGFTRPGHVGGCWAAITPFIASGELDPIIGSVFPLEQAADALTVLDERRAIGKVVLTM
jgi:NADPH2:quinone reductase